MSPATRKEAMTTKEACQRLGIGLRRLQVLLAEGKLPGSYKVGLLRFIPKRSVEKRAQEVAEWRRIHASK
jgi:excisionase family DNA binding protein